MKQKLLYVLVLLPLIALAQTNLQAGDIAIIHNQADTPDDFAFVTFVDLQPGTEIIFTDCGADAAGFNTPCTEGAYKYSVPAGGHLAGAIIKFMATANPNFTPYNDFRITGGFATSTSGDQIIAFQGTGDIPTFIFASNTASTLFTGNKADTNQTGLPTGLDDTTAPRSALGLGTGEGTQDEWDNVVYSGVYDFNSIAEAKLALTDPNNYYGINSTTDTAYANYVTTMPDQLTLPTLSIQNFELENAITVYPIPSNDGMLTIHNTNSQLELLSVEVYDVTGKQIAQQDLNAETIQPLNLTGINTGIYYVRISDNNHNSVTKKVIIK